MSTKLLKKILAGDTVGLYERMTGKSWLDPELVDGAEDPDAYAREVSDQDEDVRHIDFFCQDIQKALLGPAPGSNLRRPASRPAKRMTVYRALRAPSLNHIHWNNIGSCWAYEVEGADVYQEPHELPKEWDHKDLPYQLPLIVLRGVVNTADVDWEKTTANKVEHPQEYEIRMLPGSLITVTGYYTGHRKPSDWSVFTPLNKSIPARVHRSCGTQKWRPRT